MTIFFYQNPVCCVLGTKPSRRMGKLWSRPFFLDIPEMKKATNVFGTTDFKIQLKKTHATSTLLCLREHILSLLQCTHFCQKYIF